MAEDRFVLAYDIGTTGVKTCLCDVSERVHLVASSLAEYPIRILQNGGAEQEPDDWWAREHYDPPYDAEVNGDE